MSPLTTVECTDARFLKTQTLDVEEFKNYKEIEKKPLETFVLAHTVFLKCRILAGTQLTKQKKLEAEAKTRQHRLFSDIHPRVFSNDLSRKGNDELPRKSVAFLPRFQNRKDHSLLQPFRSEKL